MEGSFDIDPKLLEILVCPLTKAPLRYDRAAQELISDEAGLAYPIRDGIPIMLVDEARAARRRREGDKRRPKPDDVSDGGTAPWPIELRLKQRGKAARDRVRRRQALQPAGRISARRKPLGRGAGPRAGAEA